MIIWGSRGVTSSQEQGEFYCPNCSASRQYKHKKVRRFFTLYFIPLIPMGELGEYVECDTCKRTFVPEVLTSNTLEGQKRLRQDLAFAVCAAMGHIVGAEGSIAPDRLQEIVSSVRAEFGGDESPELLESKVTRRPTALGSLGGALATARECLTENGKELVLRTAARIAGGREVAPLRPTIRSAMEDVGKHLGLSSAHIKGVLAEIDERVSS